MNHTAINTMAGEILKVSLTGRALLGNPGLNKGTAFTREEREELGLQGLLPTHVDSLGEQVTRAYEAYQPKNTDMGRHIYLRALQDTNETLFYRLLVDHLVEMMPIIYTPVVGLACEQFSHIYRRPQGLFISYPERDAIDVILDNAAAQVEVIVVTDGARILGLGDQGVGGMGIPIGKLSLYTACGGIDPATTLPVFLDVGTNNPGRLADPMYLGWRHERIDGKDYDDFIDAFVQGVIRKFPNVLLQWEDFSKTHANALLDRYRNRLCSFNDDIQGTAAVTLGTLLAAVRGTGSRLRDQRVAIVGAGSAGCGISEQLMAAMVQQGLSETEARARFFLINRSGLLHDGLGGLQPFQQRFVQPRERLAGWQRREGDGFTLAEVVRNARPTILIGVSGQPGVFTEDIVREMARHVERPIIFPLSNPTSRIEAAPVDLISWTHGRALVATGSPFADISYRGRRFPVAQCNNTYIFPGLGLGVIAAEARRITDGMIMAAAQTLSEQGLALGHSRQLLLPPLTDICEVSRRIALAVAREAQREGVAKMTPLVDLQRRIDAKYWEPRYQPMRLKR